MVVTVTGKGTMLCGKREYSSSVAECNRGHWWFARRLSASGMQ